MSPRARLEFNLPEELTDFTLAKDSGNLYYMLSEVQQHLRKYRKYIDFSHKEYTGLKRRSKKAGAILSFFFDKLDNELLDIMRDMPEVE